MSKQKKFLVKGQNTTRQNQFTGTGNLIRLRGLEKIHYCPSMTKKPNM